MGRSVLAVLLGIILTNVIIFAMEFAGHAAYEPSAGFDATDPAALHGAMAKMPTGVFLFLLLGWVVGTVAGAWLTASISRHARIVHGLIIGGLVTLAAIMIMLHIPHPLWLWVAALVSIPAAAYAGAWLADRGNATSPVSPDSPMS
jgi:hypothetical protein